MPSCRHRFFFFYKEDIDFCVLVFCPPPGGTHLLCDPSSPLPVETGKLASREGPGTWESRGKEMGGSGSKATVLENMIKNLKKGLGGDYGVEDEANRFHILCEVEWTPMGAGWHQRTS